MQDQLYPSSIKHHPGNNTLGYKVYVKPPNDLPPKPAKTGVSVEIEESTEYKNSVPNVPTSRRGRYCKVSL